MNTHKDFFDKPIFTIPSYIYNLFLGGLYFIVCNPFLLLFYIITAYKPELFNYFFLFLSLIPLGPSLSALYSTMYELRKEKSISISSYFFKSYKENFIDTMKLWAIQLSLIILLAIDFQYFFVTWPQFGIHILVLFLAIYIIVVGFYAFPINIAFKIKVKDLILLSFYYTLKKFPTTILKVLVLIISYKLSSIIPELFLIFIPSSISLLFSYYDGPIIEEIKVKHNKK